VATFVSGQRLTAAQLEDLLPLWKRKTSTETLNNDNTLQNDDQLFLPVAANTEYQLEMRLRISSGATPDWKCLFTFPVGLTMNYNVTTITAGATTLQNFDLDQTSTTTVEGGQTSLFFDGTVVVSSTAGTLQLQWAQNTANASDTSVLAGSYLKLMKVV
jgi:hypothetical protein